MGVQIGSFSFDVACMQCGHPHSHQQVPFACVAMRIASRVLCGLGLNTPTGHARKEARPLRNFECLAERRVRRLTQEAEVVVVDQEGAAVTLQLPDVLQRNVKCKGRAFCSVWKKHSALYACIFLTNELLLNLRHRKIS